MIYSSFLIWDFLYPCRASTSLFCADLIF